jgi:phage shock protein C
MENRKLYRSKFGSIGGVCTGIANYFKIEPLLIQVIFFALIWSPFPIILTYILLWIFMKKEY